AVIARLSPSSRRIAMGGACRDYAPSRSAFTKFLHGQLTPVATAATRSSTRRGSQAGTLRPSRPTGNRRAVTVTSAVERCFGGRRDVSCPGRGGGHQYGSCRLECAAGALSHLRQHLVRGTAWPVVDPGRHRAGTRALRR